MESKVPGTRTCTRTWTWFWPCTQLLLAKKPNRVSLKQKCQRTTSKIKPNGNKWVAKRGWRWRMSALADYFPSADCRQPALWSKILCCTRSQNPLALGKRCDGTDALQRKAWSTVPAAGSRRWGHSSKTMSLPEPVRKPPQIISSKLH